MPVGAPAGGPPMPPMPPGGAPPAMPPGAEVPGVGPGMGAPGLPGAMPGMGGAMPGAGVAAAAAPAGPPEKTITYQQYLDESGSPPNPVLPEYYKKQKRTSAEWHQLFRIYPAKAALAVGRRVQPGASLYEGITRTQARIQLEVRAVERAHKLLAEKGFRFVFERPMADQFLPDLAGLMTIMRVYSRPHLATKVLRILEPLSVPNLGGLRYTEFHRWSGTSVRAPIHLITPDGGYFHPRTVWLDEAAVSRWNELWNQTQIKVRVLSADGTTVSEGLTPLPATGTALMLQFVMQPERSNIAGAQAMALAPWAAAHRVGEEDWNGRPLSVPDKCWAKLLTLMVPLSKLPDVDRIEAEIVVGAPSAGAAVGGPMGGLPGARPPMPGGGAPPGAMPPSGPPPGGNKTVHVRGHWRRTPSGGRTWVDEHYRSPPGS